MKKRVLSLLLTLVMLVSAMPVLLLSASAADTEESYDYSSLYVTDGAILMMDFFNTNSIWKPDGMTEEDLLPVAPIFGEDYADIDVRMDFWIEDAEGKLVSDASMSLAAARAELIALRRTDPANEKGYVLRSAYDETYAEDVVANANDRILFWITSANGALTDEDGIVYFDTIDDAVATAAEKTIETGVKYEVTSNTVDWTPDYKPTINGYVNNVKAWLKSNTFFGTAPGWSEPKPAYALGQTWRDATGEYGFAPFDAVAGGLTFHPYGHNDAYLSLGGGALSSDTTVTAQYVMLPGYDFGSRTFMLRGVELATEAIYAADPAEGDTLVFKGIEGYNQISSLAFPAYGEEGAYTIPLDNTKPMDITYEVTHSVKAKDDDGNELTGKAALWYNGNAVFTSNVNYNSDLADATRNSLINYGHNISSTYFAIRMYNRALTADEMTLNHFADIAKWYKLDIGAIVSLPDAKKLAIAEQFTDDVIGGGLAERELLVAKLKGIVDEVVYNALAEGIALPTAACLDFIELAKGLSLDIAAVLSLDPIDRETVYAVANAMPAAQKTSRSMVQGAVDQAVEAIIQEKYGAYLPEAAPDYKDLYVRQDQLVTWADFYAATPNDGKLYMDYSYPEETWNLPHTVKQGNTTVWNPDKLRTPEVSGEAAAREKYFFKGGDKLLFGDIGDKGWGHSNIREWGDGRLICGQNNVLKLSSADHSSPAITYQIVMDWTGAINFQLDTFRVNFANPGTPKTGRLSSYTYYTFCGETGPAEDKTFSVNNPNAGVKYSSSLDITLTLDRTYGVDSGHYYLVEQDADAEGNLKFSSTNVGTMNAVRKNAYVYKTEIGGKTYYVSDTATSKYLPGDKAAFDVYGPRIVVLTVDEEGKAHYITAEKDGKLYYAFYEIKDGAVVEEPIIYQHKTNGVTEFTAATTVAANPAVIYVNPPREVPKGTPGATQEIFDDGTANLKGYLNGANVLDVTGMPVNGSDIGWLGNGGNPTFFALRTYTCVLTEAEILQNHFADLAGFYGFDLTMYNYLTEAQKTTLFEAMKPCEVGGDRAAALALYDATIAGILYDFGTDEAAVNFSALARAYALDVRALIPLSDTALRNVIAAFASYSATGTYSQPVLQKTLNDVIAAQYRDHYAAAVGHGAIGFAGWQLHLEGDLGLRALFATDLELIRDLAVRGTTVKTGLLMAEASDDLTADTLKAAINTATGEITLAEDSGITLVQGYWETAAAEGTFVKDGDLYFTKDVIVEDDLDAYEIPYVYVGFAIAEDENGEITVFFADTTRGTTDPGTAQSLHDLTEAARIDYRMAYPNIQKVMNEIEGVDPYVSIFAGSAALTDLLLVNSPELDAMGALQDLLVARIAVELTVAPTASADLSKGGYVLLSGRSTAGAYANTYGDGFYGITVQNGNLYLWYNSGATAADAVAYFCEIVNYYADQQEDIHFAENVDYVRRNQ